MRTPSVFVVDDEHQICELLGRILGREGFDVHRFQDPLEALDAALREPPDAILTDLMMPGLSGLDLIKRVREQYPDVGAVVMTGYASIENVVDALRNDIDDFVPKPFSVTEIRTVVSRVLQARRSDAARKAAVEHAAAKGPPTADINDDTGETADAFRESHETATGSSENQLARKLRDMSVAEQVHTLLGRDLAVGDLVPRVATTLSGALSITHAVLLVPGAEYGTFHVGSSTVPEDVWTDGEAIPLPALALVAASGIPATVDHADVGPLAALLDQGALAAAPICPRGRSRADAGVLVASRALDGPEFHGDALRLLGIAATALGHVYRALEGPARTESAYVRSLESVVQTSESRTPWFGGHANRVGTVADRLGRRVGLEGHELRILDVAARLLDLGRVGIPDAVLDKPAQPTSNEWDQLRRHVLVSDDLIEPVGVLGDVKPVVRHHHENWDGSGYPDGLRGEEIPFLAALVRIADSYAALTSDRPWRAALEPAAAVREIVRQSGAVFHPELVAAFTELFLSGEGDGLSTSGSRR